MPSSIKMALGPFLWSDEVVSRSHLNWAVTPQVGCILRALMESPQFFFLTWTEGDPLRAMPASPEMLPKIADFKFTHRLVPLLVSRPPAITVRVASHRRQDYHLAAVEELQTYSFGICPVAG